VISKGAGILSAVPDLGLRGIREGSRAPGSRGYVALVCSSRSERLDLSRVARPTATRPGSPPRRAIPRGPIIQLTDDK